MTAHVTTSYSPCLSSSVSNLEGDELFWTDDEKILLCWITNQDQQAFNTLYRRYAPRIRGYLSRYIQQPELIDEVLQDVMLVLWRQAHRFNPDKRLSTWLLGIARHKALSAVRVAERLPERLPELPVCADADPEVLFSREQRADTITRALDSLPLEQRTVVELTYYQGYSSQEIAACTGVSVNTIRSRLRLAQQRLASALAKRQAGADTL